MLVIDRVGIAFHDDAKHLSFFLEIFVSNLLFDLPVGECGIKVFYIHLGLQWQVVPFLLLRVCVIPAELAFQLLQVLEVIRIHIQIKVFIF